MRFAAKKAAMTAAQKKYIPEYERLGKRPIPLMPGIPQTHKMSPPKQRVETVQKKVPHFPQETVEELEEDEKNINHSEIETEFVQDLANIQADPYSYLVVAQGECVELLPSKQELEEFLEKIIFENPDQEEAAKIMNSIEIWKKIPFKSGIHILD